MTGYKEFYNSISKKVTRCPKTGKQGKPIPGNELVWFVEYTDHRGVRCVSRWSYATGRLVEKSAEETNVL